MLEAEKRRGYLRNKDKRYEIAKDTLASLVGSPEVVRELEARYRYEGGMEKVQRYLCQTAVKLADMLLDELEKT